MGRPTRTDRSSRGSSSREFSGMQLDEVVHADRLLACEVEQVVGHTIVAALLDYYDLLNVFIFGARIMHCFFRLAGGWHGRER